MRYRPDVDGLRALAILPILLYHFGIPIFGGGFVGVDVFFVISGFLISRIIISEIEAGEFSLGRFLARRARRILPALSLVLTACAIVGWQVMMPPDYERLGMSIAAAAAFVSNVFFWRQGGYFSPNLREMPLLHTWSLGIEEQFYILLPLFFLAAARLRTNRRQLLIAVAGAAMASACLSTFMVHYRPGWAFYLLPFRAWELLLGVLLGLAKDGLSLGTGKRRALSSVGLALIAAAVFLFSKSTTFPGPAALIPTMGAALIIYAADAANPILVNRFSILIGKMSYSLYLWHFPVLAFAAYLLPTGLPPVVSACLAVPVVLLSYLSWRFVEIPARHASIGVPRLLAVAGAGAASLIVFGLAVRLSDGVPTRLTREELAFAAEKSSRQWCFVNGADDLSERRCPLGIWRNGTTPPTFALLGDSHAEALSLGVHHAALHAGLGGFYLGVPGCPPLETVNRVGSSHCAQLFGAILAKVLSMKEVTTIILHGRWAVWADGSPYLWEAFGADRLAVQLSDQPFESNAVTFDVGLRRTVDAIRRAGKQLWIVGPVPEVGVEVPKSLFLTSRGFLSQDFAPTRAAFERRAEVPLRELARLDQLGQIRLFLPHKTLCSEDSCMIQHAGRPLYVDDDHLGLSGSLFLADAMFSDMLSRFPGARAGGEVAEAWPEHN